MRVEGLNYTDVPLEDIYPEGWHRCKVTGYRVLPKDFEILPNMQVKGELDKNGNPRYAVISVDFRFEDHDSNREGEDVVGERVNDIWSFAQHSRFLRRNMREFLEAVAIPHNPDDFDLDLMADAIVDVNVQNEEDRRSPGKKTARIKSIRAALD